MSARDAAWVAGVLQTVLDNEAVFLKGHRHIELEVEHPETTPGVLVVDVYRPGVEDRLVRARVTVQVVEVEEPDGAPDHQGGGWEPSEAQAVMASWEHKQELTS